MKKRKLKKKSTLKALSLYQISKLKTLSFNIKIFQILIKCKFSMLKLDNDDTKINSHTAENLLVK